MKKRKTRTRKEHRVEGETVCRACLEVIPQDELSPSHRGRNFSICGPCSKKLHKERYYNDADKRSYHKEYYKKNAERLKLERREYVQNNRDKIREYRRRPENRIRKNQQKAVSKALASVGKQKTYSTLKYLGCTAIELKKYLEARFQEGMSWDNYGNPNGDHTDCWHIDHIRPIASFDLSDEGQVRVCFHFTNLQPLWAEENLAKGEIQYR